MSDDLARLEEWFGEIIKGMTPAQRRKATLKLGRELRKSNLSRIARNAQPDGSKMEARKPRSGKKGKLRGKMFQGLRYAWRWKIDPSEDGVEVGPYNAVIDRIASVHHFGEEAPVGRSKKDGRIIRHKYAERHLLGFSQSDENISLDIAAALLDPDK
jgi:phage virion morphogenesis protein